MPEIKILVKPILVEYACDECSRKPNPGCIVKPTGCSRLTTRPTFQYICPNCDKHYWFTESYPTIKYEPCDD